MKVLVFGANGYLGRHFVRELLKKNDMEISGSDIQENSVFLDEIKFCQMDLTSLDKLKKFDFSVFEVIYYFSGITGTKDSFDNFSKYIEVNQVGLLNLLSIIAKFKKKPLIVFPSTRLVYKGIKNKSICERSEKEFKTIYGLSKYSGEQYLKMYNNLYQIPYIIVRICIPYGNLFKGAYSYGTVGFFMRQAKLNKKITVYGAGSLKRTFTHVGDICNQIYKLTEIKLSYNNTFNISGEALSLKQVAEPIASKYKASISYLPWPKDDLLLESGDTVFNSAKIENTLNEKLKYSFISWLSENTQ